MTILGRGDLAPPRRRRGRGPGRWLAVLVALAIVGAGGYLGWRQLSGGDDTTSAGVRPTACPTATRSAVPLTALTAPVRIRVLNGTKRVGLAHRVAKQLRRQHFLVRHVGNTRRVNGASQIRFSTAAEVAAHRVAAWIPGARLVSVTGNAAVVDVAIGSTFSGVASPVDAKQALLRYVSEVRPSPTPCPSS